MDRTIRRGIRASLAATVVVGLSLGAEVSTAYQPVGSELRFSNVGPDNDVARGGIAPAIAYNSMANEYLVVWMGNPLTDPGEVEIYGQRLSATGAELGGDFRISEVGNDGDVDREANDPSVAYNSDDNEYLVVWHGDDATDNKVEIHGQLLDAAGGDVGEDFSISATGMSTDPSQGAETPDVAYNPADNQYMVTWQAGNVNGENTIEIFGQRLDADGVQLPDPADIQISNGEAQGPERQALESSVAYGSGPDEYYVVWNGDQVVDGIDDDYETFGQRLSDLGVEQGGDTRLTVTGPEGDVQRATLDPAVVYGSGPDEYLVTWYDDGGTVDGETEVFGQRVSATTGAEQGVDDFRISTTGVDGSAQRGAFFQSAAYSSAANEYMVTWAGDPLATDDEFEIFGQRLSASAGDIGSDFRISTVGNDGDDSRDAGDPEAAFGDGIDTGSVVAYGSTPNEYMVAWGADDLTTDNEFEIFGQRLGIVPPTTGTPPQSTPATKCKKKKKRTANAAKKKKKKKGCKKKKKKKKR